MYNVKLSNDAIENLRNMIGVSEGKLNLKTGVIQIEGKSNVKKIAEKFGIDNVNHLPYEEAIAEPAKPTTSLEERNKIIGYDLQVGSVVRVKTDNGTEHAVIIAVNDRQYIAARLVLSDVTSADEGQMRIPLKKGEDIVYRNMTYRDIVTLTGDIAYDLRWRDFMKGAGGMIVGKVTNLELIQPVINLIEASGEEEVHQNDPVSDTNDSNSEPLEEGEKEGINFLKVIEDSETLDELFSKLEVASEILKQAAEECIETGRSNVKKLVPVLQSKYEKAYGRLTQSAIKNKMNEEFKEWCESHNVDMEECSVSYFLKNIVKGLKKS